MIAWARRYHLVEVCRRWLAVACATYALALLGIVVIADLGGTERMFGFVRWIPHGDQLGHFALMGTLALLADLAFRRDLALGRLRVPAAPLVVTLLVTAEELTQLALPTRSFDLADLASDLAGIGLFTAVGRRIGRAAARAAAQGAVDQ